MIFVIHGTDTDSSYKRFSQLLSSYSNYTQVSFDKHSQKDDLTNAFLSQDLFSTKKVIVIKNTLIVDKSLISLLEKAPRDLEVIIWENDELTGSVVTKISKIAKVENFKLPAKLFYFLDSIAPKKKEIIAQLNKLDDEASLIWNIQNRFLLLTLAKLRVDVSLAGKITKRNLADWQWSKIRQQAEKFTLLQLKSICNASLKIDYLIKSGQTDLSPTILLSVMFLKYL
ncbi:MAG: hypothetical protein Q8P25_05340 [Candidatus Curtissbacteria bacterium]|nr:hypothetical protein [Candidatus Curtissbacteria bacterium]